MTIEQLSVICIALAAVFTFVTLFAYGMLIWSEKQK